MSHWIYYNILNAIFILFTKSFLSVSIWIILQYTTLWIFISYLWQLCIQDYLQEESWYYPSLHERLFLTDRMIVCIFYTSWMMIWVLICVLAVVSNMSWVELRNIFIIEQREQWGHKHLLIVGILNIKQREEPGYDRTRQEHPRWIQLRKLSRRWRRRRRGRKKEEEEEVVDL